MAEPQSVSHVEEERLEHSHAGRYVAVWIALLVFTVLTWAISKVHLGGGWHITVALVIAVVKGTLVALFFMHLWGSAARTASSSSPRWSSSRCSWCSRSRTAPSASRSRTRPAP